jgi:NADH dehydrogenase I D subunit
LSLEKRISTALLEERKDADGTVLGKTMVMNLGPQHPATHGTLRLILELDGEVVVKCHQEIGFLHTGFEKLGEFRDYNQFITVTDRANYLSPLCNNIGFARAVEELLGVEIPERAQYIEVILAELSRIADHVISVGLQAMDLGAFSVMLWAFVEREKLYNIFEAVTGTRLTTAYTRIGGLARDVPADFDPMVRSFLKKFPAIIDQIEGMLSKNRIFINRTRGVGAITADDALGYGLTGPLLRACGVDYDVRRTRPYLVYDELDFDVPTRSDGDVFSRYEVRLEEMRQSLRIIEQALNRMPEGPVSSINHKVAFPDKWEVYNTMEGLIHHFKLVMKGHGIKPPKGDFYSSTEAPNGELGFYIHSDGEGVPYKVHFRSPSFYNYAAVPKMVEGHLLSDVIAVMSSVNVIAGELDR